MTSSGAFSPGFAALYTLETAVSVLDAVFSSMLTGCEDGIEDNDACVETYSDHHK